MAFDPTKLEDLNSVLQSAGLKKRALKEGIRAGVTDPTNFANQYSSQISDFNTQTNPQTQDYAQPTQSFQQPSWTADVNNEFNNYTGLVPDFGGDYSKFSWGEEYNPSNYLKSIWNDVKPTPYTGPSFNISKPATPAFSLFGQPAKPNPVADLFTQMRDTGKQYQLDRAMADPGIAQELLGQYLSTGYVNPALGQTNRDPFGGNKIADALTGEQLQKLLTSKDLLYDGKKLGSIYNKPAEYKDSWNDFTKKKSSNLFTKKVKTAWDYGDTGAFLSVDDPDWYSKNAYGVGDNQFFIDQARQAQMPGGKSVDWYDREKGKDTQKSFTGLGKIANFALNFVPGIGPALSYAHGLGSLGGKVTPGGALGAMYGVAAPSLQLKTGLGAVADKAIQGAGKGAITAALNKGNILEGALRGGATSGLGGWAGKEFNSPAIGSVASTATSMGLNELLKNKAPTQIRSYLNTSPVLNNLYNRKRNG